MIPTKFLFGQMPALFIENPATIGGEDPDFPKLRFILNDYVDGPNLVRGDLTLATTEVVLGAIGFIDGNFHIEFTSEGDGEICYRIPDTAVYRVVSDGVVFPFTIFGVALVSNDDATLFATQRLDVPAVFTVALMGAAVPPMQFTFPFNCIR